MDYLVDLSALSTWQPFDLVNFIYLVHLSTCQPVDLVSLVYLVDLSTCQPCRPVNLSTVSVMTAPKCVHQVTVDLVRTGTLFYQLLAFYFCSG